MNRNCIFHFFSNAIILTEMWASKSITVRLSIYDSLNFYMIIYRAGEEVRERQREWTLSSLYNLQQFFVLPLWPKRWASPWIFCWLCQFCSFLIQSTLGPKTKAKGGREKTQKMEMCLKKKKSQKLTTYYTCHFSRFDFFLNTPTAI